MTKTMNLLEMLEHLKELSEGGPDCSDAFNTALNEYVRAANEETEPSEIKKAIKFLEDTDWFGGLNFENMIERLEEKL